MMHPPPPQPLGYPAARKWETKFANSVVAMR